MQTLDRYATPRIPMSAVHVDPRAAIAGAVAVAWAITALRLPGLTPAVADQADLLKASWLGDGWWPAPIQGPLSQAIAATVRLVVPSGYENVVFQSTANALLLASAATLTWTACRSVPGTVAVLALLVSSPLVVVWLSSETILAAAIMGVLIAARRGPGWVVGVACVAVAFAKPDGILLAALMAAWFGWSRRDATIPAAFVGVAAVLMAPGTLLVDGYWNYTPDASISRTWVAFGQHFANAVGGQQYPAGPDPWAGWQVYTGRLLPGADSAWSAVTLHPAQYLRFLREGWVIGIHDTVRLFGPLLAVTVGAAACWRRLGTVGRGAALTLVGIVPNLLLTYPSLRHQLRWYPLAVIGAVVLAERSDMPWRWWLVVGAGLVWNVA